MAIPSDNSKKSLIEKEYIDHLEPIQTFETQEENLTEIIPLVIEIAVATSMGIDIVTNGIEVIDKKKKAIEKAAKTIKSWRQPNSDQKEITKP